MRDVLPETGWLCPNSMAESACASACIVLGEQYPSCAKTWATVYHCRSVADLVCDSDGVPSTTRCVYYTSSYDVCVRIASPVDGG
jgi:hypothetical protein